VNSYPFVHRIKARTQLSLNRRLNRIFIQSAELHVMIFGNQPPHTDLGYIIYSKLLSRSHTYGLVAVMLHAFATMVSRLSSLWRHRFRPSKCDRRNNPTAFLGVAVALSILSGYAVYSTSRSAAATHRFVIISVVPFGFVYEKWHFTLLGLHHASRPALLCFIIIIIIFFPRFRR